MKPYLENVELSNEQSIVAFRYNKPDFVTPWHFHPQHELTYIEGSKGTKFVGDFVGSFQEGELVLIKSYLPHYWKNYNEQNTHSISTVVQWNKGLIPKLPEMKRIEKMIDTSSKGIIYQKEDIQSLLPSILVLTNVVGSELVVQFLDLLMRLSNCRYETLSTVSFTSGMSSLYENRMALIHEYVAENYGRKIKLIEVARLMSLSEQSFSRFFKKMMGRSFFKFLGEYRVNIATRMLIDTDWPISRIGYACGYESIPFFYKQFKQLKGDSPLKFRLNH